MSDGEDPPSGAGLGIFHILGPLPPVLTSAALLLAGNGLITTLVAVRGQAEGLSETAIGVIGTAYFLGFFAAAVMTGPLIGRVGHIRVFAGLAAMAAVVTLLMALYIDVTVWCIARFVTGFAFSGVATVIESWLNEVAGNRGRGRVLSIYRVVDLTAVSGSQFLMPMVGANGFEIFAVVTLLFSASVIPVSLSRLTAPPPPPAPGLSVGAVWAISPVACVGIFIVGMTNGAFRTVGPVYAGALGLDVEKVALFMTCFIVGGAALQLPLGWLSDRVERRMVLIVVTGLASVASFWLTALDGADVTRVMVGVAIFGSFVLPLYSLSVAHANDYCPSDRFVTLAVGILLFYSIGAAAGAPLSAAIVERFGAHYFFVYTGSLHAVFIAFVLYRRSRRSGVPAEARRRFVSLLRTSPMILRLGAGRRSPAADRD